MYEYEDGLLRASQSVYHGWSEYLCSSVGRALTAILLSVPTAIIKVNGISLSILYLFGPMFCVLVSAINLVQNKKYYGSVDSAKFKAAMDIFYSLALFQGLLFYFWLVLFWTEPRRMAAVNRQCLFGCWGRQIVHRYLRETKVTCANDLASPAGWNLISFAVSLVATGTWEDQLSGARILDTLVGHNDAPDLRRRCLLSSSQCMRNLIAALGRKGYDFREIRDRAARIVADVAGDIVMSQFPGALQCISSLVECSSSDALETLHLSSEDRTNVLCGDRVQRRPSMVAAKKNNAPPTYLFSLIYNAKLKVTDPDSRKYCECNSVVSQRPEELIMLKGFLILEKLAGDKHNCREIIKDEVLLSRIMAPMNSYYSTHNDQDAASAGVLNGSMSVVISLLVSAHGEDSRQLRQEIARNADTVDGMICTLQGDIISTNCTQALKERAIEILTEVSLGTDSTAMTSKSRDCFVTTLFRIFTADRRCNNSPREEEVKEQAAKTMGLRRKAGCALKRLLSIDAISSSFGVSEMFWGTISTGAVTHSGFIQGLTEILASNLEICYRLCAAEILEILCNHSVKCDEYRKNSVISLLTKVNLDLCHNIFCFGSFLESCIFFYDGKEILLFQVVQQTLLTEPDDDLKSQYTTTSGDKSSSSHAQRNQVHSENMKLMSSLLGLTTTIHDELIDAGDFTCVVRKVDQEGKFVKKLKEVTKRNSGGTVEWMTAWDSEERLRDVI